ncbi:MAG: NFACT family protein [Erysipelotrichaceae bacterium]
MAIDGIILHKIKNSLCSHLPIRINKISQSSKTELVFNVHADSIRTNMVISLHPNDAHIALSHKNYSDYLDPSTFVMVLRKYLINGIITSIEQKEFDRYLLFKIKAQDEMYDEKNYCLSLELMGKYTNLILFDSDSGKIIDAYKKIPPAENNKRVILSGAPFLTIESQKKLNPFETENINLDESLVAQLQGFSKVLEKEIRYRLENQSFKEIMTEIEKSDKFYIYDNEYHIIELKHLNSTYKIFNDISEGFDYLYYQKSQEERIKSVTDDIFKFIKRQQKHYNTKLDKLKMSLYEAENLEEDKTKGDTLYICSDLEKKGLKEIDVEDYEGNMVHIALDPKLTIKQNANKYYQIYAKKRKGISYIKEQIEICEGEINYFNAISEQLSMASYQDGLQIKEELMSYGYLKKNKAPQKKKKKINLYQIKYGDYTITWGKNNLQNNFLTFDYARNNYTFFHAKDYHGAHVVVNSDRLNEEVIRLAANIAAYYSSGRLSSSVPVDYCSIKDVKKIKGAKPGFVSIRNQKTIYIDPEEPSQDISLI